MSGLFSFAECSLCHQLCDERLAKQRTFGGPFDYSVNAVRVAILLLLLASVENSRLFRSRKSCAFPLADERSRRQTPEAAAAAASWNAARRALRPWRQQKKSFGNRQPDFTTLAFNQGRAHRFQSSGPTCADGLGLCHFIGSKEKRNRFGFSSTRAVKTTPTTTRPWPVAAAEIHISPWLCIQSSHFILFFLIIIIIMELIVGFLFRL